MRGTPFKLLIPTQEHGIMPEAIPEMPDGPPLTETAARNTGASQKSQKPATMGNGLPGWYSYTVNCLDFLVTVYVSISWCG